MVKSGGWLAAARRGKVLMEMGTHTYTLVWMRETERTRNNEKRERRNLTCMKKTKKREKKEGKEVERTCARGG